MAKYHINDKGVSAVCHATKKPCKFGGKDGLENHYDTKSEADKAIQDNLEKEYSHLKHKSKNSKSNNNKKLKNTNILDLNLPKWAKDKISPTNKIVKNKDLNITSREFKGAAIDNLYFAEQQISGKIDYTKLNEKSFKEFGFIDPTKRKNDGGLSEEELEIHQLYSDDEYRDKGSYEDIYESLVEYTEGNDSYINPILRKKKSALDSPDDDEFMMYGEYKKGTSFKQLQRITKNMDEGLINGSGIQRIVYRGITIPNIKSKDNKVKKELDDSTYDSLKREFSVGQEAIFDDYQSTSLDRHIATSFTGFEENSILFEIRTSEGLSLSSISGYSEEDEVLLPRKSRYMVVGSHELYKNVANSGKNKKKRRQLIVQMVAINEDGEILEQKHDRWKPKPLSEDDVKIVKTE